MSLSKADRKQSMSIRKEQLLQDQLEKERMFREKQDESFAQALKRLQFSHREKIALLERQFLQQKQQLERSKETALWELEERQMQERHQLVVRQLKDSFFLKRHQMLVRDEKDLEHTRRNASREEEDLLKRQAVERRQLPKRIRSEMKTRELIFRESLRLSNANLANFEDERERVKRFQESEKQRYSIQEKEQLKKHKLQLQQLRELFESTIREQEQLQNEKRKLLLEHEQQKIQQLQQEQQQEYRQWKSNLRPRKQVRLDLFIFTLFRALI
jgi:STE20-like kinase